MQSYYSIVKRTVSDMVPKAAMLHLVNYAKENLQRELLTEIYGRAQRDSAAAAANVGKKNADNGEGGTEWESFSAENLLQEAEGVVERRNECRRMIEALTRAEEIVSAV